MEPLAPEVPEQLARPEAHADDPSAAAGVRWVQTHISHVFLTGARAVKLRKAVSLGFVDFGTRAARNADCAREVRLNRRLAPDVYLGVAPVERVAGAARVGALVVDPDEAALAADPREHVVVMRRLPDGRDALSLLARGALRAGDLDAVARVLARFHAENGLGAPSPFSPEEWRARVLRPALDNLALLESGAGRLFPRATWTRLCQRTRDFAARHAADFEARRLAGRAVDGHGDVHLQHVWLEPGRDEPLLVDCIEFDERLRRIDAAADAAFLAMDLAYRGRRAWSARFLRTYADHADDFDLYRVIDFYLSYRAAVRAKVAAIAADDAGIAAAQRRGAATSARRHLALALRALAPRGRGALVLVCGVVGTGKSTAAAALADASEGVAIASDRVRRRLFGLAETERGGAARGLYTEAAKERVYEALLAAADPVLASGRVAILDATYARRRHREAALAWARARGTPAWIVETTCSEQTARARLARRAARDRDPSDAGPELYAWSRDHFDPLSPPRDDRVVTLDTDHPRWRARLRALARELRAAAALPRAEGAESCRIAPSAP